MRDDLKFRLDRLAERATPPGGSDALDRLQTARARRSRSRRITAGALALVIAMAGTATVITAFDRDPTGGVADDPSPSASATPAWAAADVLTVWPENPVRSHVTDPAMIQGYVDRGDDQLQWRLDPEEVARRFAGVVLGWTDVTVVGLDVDTDVDVRAYEITPCPPDATCDLEVPMPTVWLRQPATQGAGGIWSVVQVTSPSLEIELPTESILRGGTDIRFDLELFASRAVHIGFAAANGCRAVTELDPGHDSGRYAIPVPAAREDDGSDCAPIGAGYVFAYVQDDTTVPVGDPLLEAAAFEFPFLAMVPIRLEMTSTEPAAAVDRLSITCAREGLVTKVDQRIVRAGVAGVAISTAPDEGMPVMFDGRRGRILIVDDAPIAINLAPGTHTVGCIYEGDIIGGEETFEVVDPAGLYVDPFGDCTPGGIFADFAPIIVEHEDRLLDAAGRTWEVSADQLATAGYRESVDERIFVAYDGVPGEAPAIGVVWFESRRDGTWISTSLLFCER